MLPCPAVPGCCLVSFHFLCDMHSIHSIDAWSFFPIVKTGRISKVASVLLWHFQLMKIHSSPAIWARSRTDSEKGPPQSMFFSPSSLAEDEQEDFSSHLMGSWISGTSRIWFYVNLVSGGILRYSLDRILLVLFLHIHIIQLQWGIICFLESYTIFNNQFTYLKKYSATLCSPNSEGRWRVRSPSSEHRTLTKWAWAFAFILVKTRME